jgi:DNA-binding LacI/PurR family transcriptional regulator
MKRFTINDVAKRAGVSTGTVSAVLNDRPNVRDRTRMRVLSAIDELGYQPSPSARILRSGRNNGQVLEKGVGLLIKEMDNPFYMDIVIGARDFLREAGYATFVCASDGDYEKEGNLINSIRNRFFQGVILAPVLHEAADLSHLFILKRAAYPFVTLEEVSGLQAHSVGIDNVEAAYMAVHHLIETGHQKIAHIAGPAYTQHTRDRIRGVERAFSQSSLIFSDDVIVPAGAHFEDGYRAGINLFKEREETSRPTAVTCFNDLVAMGVLRALAELGLDVPGDVSVVGFDDIQAAAYLSTPLTTVKVPKREMGQRAAELLMQQIEAPEGVPMKRIRLDATLITRGSTRPLPA